MGRGMGEGWPQHSTHLAHAKAMSSATSEQTDMQRRTDTRRPAGSRWAWAGRAESAGWGGWIRVRCARRRPGHPRRAPAAPQRIRRYNPRSTRRPMGPDRRHRLIPHMSGDAKAGLHVHACVRGFPFFDSAQPASQSVRKSASRSSRADTTGRGDSAIGAKRGRPIVPLERRAPSLPEQRVEPREEQVGGDVRRGTRDVDASAERALLVLFI
ncbi:hypothetical protein K437DRAFT_97004 [Tilletiaria anomala UBC 951]|uniref:Uncharacterized protein n=1 Tax=Tilletiaria anomala (strain ATCC 24038 / CBS 436.72 / UBC 951) TaxID=1037660 RepID=A0A066WRH3_TILAU|nr:uncharacterized protein K437DRAFT_97004 [Tilletiaria anomala UBC 951]KDN53265.1 hypothetical protein K437DRAFT_97004 [Tilletiaria anomala UBC 951]